MKSLGNNWYLLASKQPWLHRWAVKGNPERILKCNHCGATQACTWTDGTTCGARGNAMTITAKSCPHKDTHADLKKGERCKVCNHPSNPDMFDALGLSPSWPAEAREREGKCRP